MGPPLFRTRILAKPEKYSQSRRFSSGSDLSTFDERVSFIEDVEPPNDKVSDGWPCRGARTSKAVLGQPFARPKSYAGRFASYPYFLATLRIISKPTHCFNDTKIPNSIRSEIILNGFWPSSVANSPTEVPSETAMSPVAGGNNFGIWPTCHWTFRDLSLGLLQPGFEVGG